VYPTTGSVYLYLCCDLDPFTRHPWQTGEKLVVGGGEGLVFGSCEICLAQEPLSNVRFLSESPTNAELGQLIG
jgi:hypothetical protein